MDGTDGALELLAGCPCAPNTMIVAHSRVLTIKSLLRFQHFDNWPPPLLICGGKVGRCMAAFPPAIVCFHKRGSQEKDVLPASISEFSITNLGIPAILAMNESARAKSSRIKLVRLAEGFVEASPARFQARPSQNQSPGICPRLVSQGRKISSSRTHSSRTLLRRIPLSPTKSATLRPGAELALSTLSNRLSQRSPIKCILEETWYINCGVGPVFQRESVSRIRRPGIASHDDCTRIADPVHVHEPVITGRINVAEHPVFPHKAVAAVLCKNEIVSHNHALIVDAGGLRSSRCSRK